MTGKKHSELKSNIVTKEKYETSSKNKRVFSEFILPLVLGSFSVIFILALLFNSSSEINGVIADITGDKLGGVKVTLDGKSVISNDDGKFSFSDAPSGVASLNFVKEGYYDKNVDINVVKRDTLNVSVTLNRIVQNKITNDFDLLAANSASNSVSLVNSETKARVNINTGETPVSVIKIPGTSKVYTLNRGDKSVNVIDIVARKVIKEIKLESTSDPVKMIFSSLNNFVYILSSDNKLIRINILDNRQAGEIVLPDSSTDIAVNPVSGYLYALAGQNILILDDQGNLIDKVTLDSKYTNIKFIPSNKSLIVFDNKYGRELLYLDLVSLSKKNIPLPRTPIDVVADSSGELAYILHSFSLVIINLPDNNIIKDDITLNGASPETLILSNDNKYLYIVNRATNDISVFDTYKMKLSEEKIKVKEAPKDLVYIK